MTTHFLVHQGDDNVGVVVVEGVEVGQALTGWRMDSDETIALEALEAIPLGHKIALRNLAEGDTLIKYGHDIGRLVQAVSRGHHVHVHNAKTKRW